MKLDNQNEKSQQHIKSILPFKIDNETGWLSTTKQLDYEEQTIYDFQVIARDFGVPFRESSAQVIIRIEGKSILV